MTTITKEEHAVFLKRHHHKVTAEDFERIMKVVVRFIKGEVIPEVEKLTPIELGYLRNRYLLCQKDLNFDSYSFTEFSADQKLKRFYQFLDMVWHDHLLTDSNAQHSLFYQEAKIDTMQGYRQLNGLVRIDISIGPKLEF